MLKLVITLSIMTIMMAATLAGFYFFMQYLIDGQQREGFSQEDLVAPIDEERPIESEDRPVFIRPGATPSFSCRLFWPVNATTKMLDGYTGIGAVLNISLENTGMASLYIERVQVTSQWGAEETGEIGKYVEPGEERYLRHILLPIPDPAPDSGNRSYSVSIDLLVEKELSWIRKEGMEFDPSTVSIMEPAPYRTSPDVNLNNPYYYDKVIDMIDQDRGSIRSLVQNSSLGIGPYSIQKVADVYEFVTGNLEYISDPDNGRNEWISPMSCLSRGGGDCEDYAILFASLIEAVGGSARVIITSGHAFNSVYIGEDLSVLDSLDERYGLDIPFLVHSDDLGNWLVIEPQSYLVFGWFPLDVEPTTGSDDSMYLYGDNDIGWNFVDTDDIYIVDIYFK